ncbi:hypothetical protein K474DRAFT_1711078 [Panus rudis PR-1116 ss-1]|nr:hypothetical protein K474DRAFT_1711078 [Panus rudis PR-1116 ss-1]
MTPAPGEDETNPREEVPISRSRATIRLPARRVASQPLLQHAPPQPQPQSQPLQLGPFVQTQPLSMVPEAPLVSQSLRQNQTSQLFPVPPHPRKSQSSPWAPHRHFTDLIGLPHSNTNGEYIYPESIMISKESQSTLTPSSIKVKIPPLPPMPLRTRTPPGPEVPISLPTLHSSSVQPSEPAITPFASKQKCLNKQCRNRVPSFFCGKCSRISEESGFTASRSKEGVQGAPFRRLKPKDLSPVDVLSRVSIRISKSLKNAESAGYTRAVETEEESSIPSLTSTPTPTPAPMLPSPGKTIPAVSAGKDVSKFFFELRKDPNPSSRPPSPKSSSPAPPSIIDLTDPRPDPPVTTTPDPGPEPEPKQDGDGDVQMRDEDPSPSSSVSPPPRSSSIVGWDSDLTDFGGRGRGWNGR